MRDKLRAVQRKSSSDPPDTGATAPERASRARQRQRLIEACISALHIYGPSHTTVEKVVALADMSPGIVRFYFASKDAMLLASLSYLAQEFEERVMGPVTALAETPVRALETLVELYLDADIASSRKVSVWYCFWGEASSRQEYLQICGQKDEDFAALVHDLIQRTIVISGATHLDADAVALGLMGVLEVLWQGFAFTAEKDIDRDAARRRSLAYLRSVFPRQFAPAPAAGPAVPVGPSESWYTDVGLLAQEREQLFRTAWQLVGHESDLPHAGDFLAVDLATERALLVRDRERRIHAFRNACRRRPHALVSASRGRFAQQIECRIHELAYALDGRPQTADTPALMPLELEHPGRFLLVRAPGAADLSPPPGDWSVPGELHAEQELQVQVGANWKLLVEQWFDAPARRERRTFLYPNQLLELSRSAALIVQVIPETPQTTRVRVLSYAAKRNSPQRRRAGAPGALPAWLLQDIEVAESVQKGLSGGALEAETAAPGSAELQQFRAAIVRLLEAAGQQAR